MVPFTPHLACPWSGEVNEQAQSPDQDPWKPGQIHTWGTPSRSFQIHTWRTFSRSSQILAWGTSSKGSSMCNYRSRYREQRLSISATAHGGECVEPHRQPWRRGIPRSSVAHMHWPEVEGRRQITYLRTTPGQRSTQNP